MSLNFTVQKVEDYQGVPEGQYTAQIENIEYKRTDFGNYHVVKWKILSPSAFEGMIHQERFNVESENDQVRHIAINNFSRFCVEIGGLKEGDDPKEEDFLFKVATILIRSRVGKKDGKSYSNIVKMELVGGDKTASNAVGMSNSGGTIGSLTYGGIQIPEVPAVSNQPLNDEVPF